MKLHIAFVGGGTGGHFYPLIGVAESLRQTDTDNEMLFYYLGPDAYDPEALSKVSMQYVHCPAGKLRRYLSWRNIIDCFKTGGGIVVAFFKLLLLYPDVIFSKGGYTSLPIVIAGWVLRIPIVIHESDAKPGLASKLATPLASQIKVAYQDVLESFPKKKTELVGIPSRSNFFTPPQPNILGIKLDRPLIFVTGGSTGAKRINDLILESLDELLEEYTVLHQTGTANEELVEQTAIGLFGGGGQLDYYHTRGYLGADEFNAALATATLIISRAGSTTIHQIALKGKPSILIPIPEDVSHDQRTNAYAYARAGATSVIEEGNLTDNLLKAEVDRIVKDEKLYQSMSQAAKSFARPQAAEKIAADLLEISYEHNQKQTKQTK